VEVKGKRWRVDSGGGAETDLDPVPPKLKPLPPPPPPPPPLLLLLVVVVVVFLEAACDPPPAPSLPPSSQPYGPVLDGAVPS
jgi:hypothetical protein